MGKRYYWLKLKDDFFRQLPIKKLRRIAGGDTYALIYLKMMLASIQSEGVLDYDGAKDEAFIENLALDIDEAEDNVKITCNFLLKNGLMVSYKGGMLLPEAKAATGSEQASAERVRKFRAREKEKALHCNTDVTPEKQISNGEKEIEKEIELEKETTNVVVVSKDSSIYTVTDGKYNEFIAYESIIGIPLTPYLVDQIRLLFLEVGQFAYDKALKKAAEMGKRNFRYIEAVARGIAAGNDFDNKPKGTGGLDFDALREKYRKEASNGN